MLNETLQERANTSENLLEQMSIHESHLVDDLGYYSTKNFESPDDVPLDAFEPCEAPFYWTRERQTVPADRLEVDVDLTNVTELPSEFSLGNNMWFRIRFEVPDSMQGHPVYLRFVAEPLAELDRGSPGRPYRVEALCYRDGIPWQAFDSGHDEMLLTDHADGGETFDLMIEVGTTTLWGGLHVDDFKLDTVEFYSRRPDVWKLYRTYKILNDLRKDLDSESPNHGRLLQTLSAAGQTFPFHADTETELLGGVEETMTILADVQNSLTSDLSNYRLNIIGHNHIDLAWLWPWAETVRKSARSFANNLRVMEEYPELRFLQSQPHLYEFAKTMYPELFDEVTEEIDEGRWIPEGATWIEPDTNLLSGESLARQYLMGKRYFRENFNVDPKVTFLPDTFGYSPALPGIAQAADCPYFFSTKILWNDVNEFPHTTFTWEGINGSSVLAHFPPYKSYNGKMNVDEVRDSVHNFKENDTIDEAVYLFGWGDGGGGVNREMMEDRRIMNETNALPALEFSTLQEHFERVEKHEDELATWVGELYLERHRGTLTSQAKTKQNNRRGEFALREAELWSAVALARDHEFTYAKEALDTAWKILLFNQFHDLLPGSSVTDVYRDADRDYEGLFEITEEETKTALDAAFDVSTDGERLCVTNSLSWTRSPLVELSETETLSKNVEPMGVVTEDETPLPVQRSGAAEDTYLFEASDVPPMGARSFEISPVEQSIANEFIVTEDALENSVIRIEFDDSGTIASVYDKDADRAVLSDVGNRLVMYRDLPTRSDAWDIEQDMYEVGNQLPAPEAVEVLESGPLRGIVRQTRTFGDSKLVQDVTLHRESKRIDFETRVEWKEAEQFLKVHFPIDVHTNSAIYETQFGHYERPTHDNTSWDSVRFEEAHQKWVDLSEPEYGVAVLNDCKYGVHVDGSDVNLSLLRAPTFPDPKADRGEHRFTYSLLPHEETIREASVIEEAYELNTPVQTVPTTDPVHMSMLDLDASGVIVEAVKRAEEDDDALVIRLYEAWGRKTSATISFELPVSSATTANLIEDPIESVTVSDDRIELKFDPFEIKTIIATIDR